MTDHLSAQPTTEDGFEEPPRPRIIEPADAAMYGWARREASLSHFEHYADLRTYLARAAMSRRPDAVLSALGRIVSDEGEYSLAEATYLAPFQADLTRLTAFLAWRSEGWAMALQKLAEQTFVTVALETSLSGEDHSGRSIASRAWPRAIAAAQRGKPLRVVTAEVIALVARASAGLRDLGEALHVSSVRQRLGNRLVPLADLADLAELDDDERRRACRRRGIPTRLARRDFEVLSEHLTGCSRPEELRFEHLAATTRAVERAGRRALR